MKYRKNKLTIKAIGRITKKIPIFHKIIYNIYNFLIIYIFPIFYLYKKITFRRRRKDLKGILGLQTIEIYKIDNIDLTNRESLLKSLPDLNFNKGGWCIYFKDAFKIINKNLFPNKYLDKKIGIKILINNKNKDPNFYGNRPFGKFGEVKEILRVGNRLYILKKGIKIFDLILLEDNYGNKSYAYLVEHCEGNYLTKNSDLKNSLSELKRDQWLKPAWGTTFLVEDFNLNKSNNNIIKLKSNEVRFLDFQSFVINDEYLYFNEIVKNFSSTSFGKKRIFANKNYLYQVLPSVQEGKRDTFKRWKIFDDLFLDSGISLKDLIVIDVGCNIGMNSYYALSRGAKYLFGIDKLSVSQKTLEILYSVGATRFDIYGIDLNSKTDLSKLKFLITEKIDIIFYCSVDGHIGYPEEINSLGFKYIVHEGHVGTTIEENFENLISHNWLKRDISKILFRTYISDGDSISRPLFIASKE
tara:strand:+ start:5759 stop:7168 length:1410 start_codon:yes stop_codon:yes gene_type:complete